MLETFTWSARIGAQGDINHRVLTAKFGDGYEQAAADGINAEEQSWPLTFVGNLAKVGPIRDFLSRHGSWRRFAWTPPMGAAGVYRSDKGYKLTAIGGGVYELSATFVQVYQP